MVGEMILNLFEAGPATQPTGTIITDAHGNNYYGCPRQPEADRRGGGGGTLCRNNFRDELGHSDDLTAFVPSEAITFWGAAAGAAGLAKNLKRSVPDLLCLAHDVLLQVCHRWHIINTLPHRIRQIPC